MVRCAACGEENPERARFCLNCAAPLVQRAPRGELRREVTILFSDVAGSTALGERLDPESLRQVMTRYFAAMRTVVERHGGTVEKFIGDAIMAVFGLPTMHEDDALRAVRAAAEMRDRLKELNEELQRDRGIRIEIRTGVMTGEVVAGDPSVGQTLVTGDTVNTAARLEQAAQAGEILLGRPTWQLVRDAVTVEPIEPVAAKGKSMPVAAVRLISVTKDAEAHRRRLEVPLVGRSRELSALGNSFERAVSERSCQLFTLLGTAGVGKSRLTAAFVASLDGRARIVRGRCLPYGEGITYWPLGDVVRAAAGITDEDDASSAREKLDRLLEGERDGGTIADAVASAVGFSPDASSQEEIFWAARRLLEWLARHEPLVVVFEDIHWAEPTFLDLIEFIADLSHDAPILLLCPARPELLDTRANWSGGKMNATTLLLEPLDRGASEGLIRALPGGDVLPEAVVLRIAEAAEGNPLYVEEMLGMLVDDGSLTLQGGAWHASGDLLAITVPPTVRALIAARLDRLPERERAVAQRASVVGRVFEPGAVMELAPEALKPEVRKNLVALVRKELVRPDRSELSGDDAFKFRHMLIRDAAYAALPKEERGGLHERFAGWLERTSGDRLAEYEEVIGYHLEQAHRYQTELGERGEAVDGLGHRAGAHLHAAGRSAVRRADLRAATDLLRRAVAVTPEGGERLWWQLDLGEALAGVDPHESHQLLGEVVEGASRGGDERLAARARVERLSAERNIQPQGWADRVEADAPELERTLSAANDQLGLASLHKTRGAAAEDGGRWEAAVEHLRRAVGAAADAGDATAEDIVKAELLMAISQGETPVQAVLELADTLLGTIRNRGARLSVRESLAYVQAIKGSVVEALREQESLIAESHDLGLVTNAAYMEDLAALYASWAGDHRTAILHCERALEQFRSVGDDQSVMWCSFKLAASLVEDGRAAEALQVLDVNVADKPGDDPAIVLGATLARAEALLALGREAEARSVYAALSESALSSLQVPTGSAMFHVRAARLVGAFGDRIAAERLARHALEIAEKKGFVLGMRRAQEVLAELQAEPGAGGQSSDE